MFSLLRGIFYSCLVAVLAYLIHLLPCIPFTIEERHPIDPLLLALILGAISRAVLGPIPTAVPGVKWASKKLLSLSIVLLGAKLNFLVILKHSNESLWLSLSCVILALILTQILGDHFGVQKRLSKLIAIGTAICGGTAIAVTSAPLKASEEEVALSMACVTLFGLICVFLMPPIGLYLELSQAQFGLWSGVVVHATPQVMATAYSYGESAGEVAIIVKMTRIILLAPILVYLNFSQKRDRGEAGQLAWNRHLIFTLFPPFLMGFLALAFLNTSQLIPQTKIGEYASLHEILTICSKASMMAAMAAIGLMVDWRSIVRLGPRPALIGLCSTLIIAVTSLALIL